MAKQKDGHQGPDLSKPWCYYIPATADHHPNGYIPSLVVANTRGHWPMTGASGQEQPWYWGKTREEAEATCEQVNAQRGVTKELATKIVSTSLHYPRVRLNLTTMELEKGGGDARGN